MKYWRNWWHVLKLLALFPGENDKSPSDGRILFKKPTSKKRDKLEDSNSPESDAKISKEKKKKKDKKNGKSLLSFEEDDEWNLNTCSGGLGLSAETRSPKS